MQVSEVDRLAAAIRETQGSFSDESGDERAKAIEQLIREGLEKLVPSERGGFLVELSKRFPTWDSDVRGVIEDGAIASQADKQEDRDWTWHVDRLASLYEELPEEQREEVCKALVAKGMASKAQAHGAWPQEPAGKVHARYYGGDAGPIDEGRALELLAMLGDVVLRLDKIVRAVWVSLVPDDRLRQPAALDRVLSAYLTGDPQAQTDKVEQQIKDLRQRAQLMIGTLAEAGRVAFNRVEFLLPPEIERMAPKSTLTRSNEHQCWVTYKKRASFIEREIFQQEIRRDLGEELRKVLGAGGTSGTGGTRGG